MRDINGLMRSVQDTADAVLQCSTVLMHTGTLPEPWRNGSILDPLKDRAIQRYKINDVSHIISGRLHAPMEIDNEKSSQEIVVYQARTTNVKYARATFLTDYLGEECIYAVPKHSVFKFMRHAYRVVALSEISIRPILEPKLWRTILQNTLLFVKKNKLLVKQGVRPVRGLLFYGPPGNGKSLMCKYLRTQFKYKRLTVTNVSTTKFQEARKDDSLNKMFSKRGLLILDDLDIAILNRNDRDPEAACSVLSAMSGLEDGQHLSIRIFTTNEKVDNIDPAFHRPGRIDTLCYFANPTADLRRQVIDNWSVELVKYYGNDKLIEVSADKSFAVLNGIREEIMIRKEMNDEWPSIEDVCEAVLNRTDMKRKPIGLAHELGGN